MNEIQTNEERLRSEIEDLKRRLAASQAQIDAAGKDVLEHPMALGDGERALKTQEYARGADPHAPRETRD